MYLRKTSLAFFNFHNKSVFVLRSLDQVIRMLLQRRLIIFLDTLKYLGPSIRQIVDRGASQPLQARGNIYI